jgi:hypothetical protein
MGIATEISTHSDIATVERTRCEVWTRVMGYHRPTFAFNAGKLEEHKDRSYFTETACDTKQNNIKGQ